MTGKSTKDVLSEMRGLYVADPVKAVRSQGFIQLLHEHVASSINDRIAKKKKCQVMQAVTEQHVLGVRGLKKVDVVLVHETAGPLAIIGVRSQMSSIGKNATLYWDGILGELENLQRRYPESVHGYVYLMPAEVIKKGRSETPDVTRYAKMYADRVHPSGLPVPRQTGWFDEFAYLVVDFESDPPADCYATIVDPAPAEDLRYETFADRIVDAIVDKFPTLEGCFP